MTERQQKLLIAIIKEFIESAEAVGSVNLVNKYRLNVSSATIRNEMAELMKLGYIEKPYSSAGRVPTTLAYKLFVDDLLSDDDDLDTTLASMIRESIYSNRFDIDEMIYSSLTSLYEITGNVSMALLGNRIYHSGLARIPTQPEFKQVKELCRLINVLEDRLLLKSILELKDKNQNVRVLFGEDTKIEIFKNMVIVYSPIFISDNQEGYIGIIGPRRIDYTKVIPAVEYVADSINEISNNW